MSRPLILATNDDGVDAPGLAALVSSLEQLGEVQVYAPDCNRSAVGHGITLHRPLRVRQVRDRWHSVDGTPTDCVLLAVRNLLGRRPDLVVSGINNGANLGDDVTYSGTVAGAYEGMLVGLPAIAFSTLSRTPKHWDAAAAVARCIAQRVLEDKLPADTALNVNIPDLPLNELEGIRPARMGRRNYEDEVIHRQDPHGASYYWIGGYNPTHIPDEGTDFDAVEHRYVSVTPLHRDMTNHAALDEVGNLNLSLPKPTDFRAGF
ncbi:MAG: 5'/3'-nucleotidase SurE [Candidatus Hydrogenedentes bacterium]|jgi:5'-nucleotidase|nr:5'/3'-nucleotidase SurE [Candidatus Hydrogenedentota bacterium]